MNFELSLLQWADDGNGVFEFNLLEIFWGKRRGALIRFGYNDGWGFDLFWVGLIAEQPS